MKRRSGATGLVLAALALTGMLTQARPFVRAVGLEGFVQEESRAEEAEEMQDQQAKMQDQQAGTGPEVWTEAEKKDEQPGGGAMEEGQPSPQSPSQTPTQTPSQSSQAPLQPPSQTLPQTSSQQPSQTERQPETQVWQGEEQIQEQTGNGHPADMEMPSGDREIQEAWQTETDAEGAVEEPGTEEPQEADGGAETWETQTGYEKDGRTVLTDIEGALAAGNGDVEIILTKADGTDFPEDYRVWLISPKEAAMGDEEEAVRIETMFRENWKQILENAAAHILPYYIQITDSGNTAVEERARITFVIHDRDFFAGACQEENVCIAGIHCADKLVRAVKDPQVSVNKETETVKISLDMEQNGWISLVCTDRAAVSAIRDEETESEEVQTGLEAQVGLGVQNMEETGSETEEAEIQGAETDEPGPEAPEIQGSEPDSPETESESDGAGLEAPEIQGSETDEPGLEAPENQESEPDSLETESEPGGAETEEAEIQMLGVARAATPEGTKLPTGAYTGVASGMRASADYNGIIYRANVSGMETFGQASSELIKGDMGIALYWQPKNADQKGSCGGIYRKVLYNNANHQWYDIKLTLYAYTKSVTASDGKEHTCYPFVGFYKESFGFSFYRAGIYVLKGEVLNSDTQAKEKVRFRLNITDIDDMQICAFKLGNGTIDKRYCMSDSIVYLKTNATVAGVGGFEQLTGADGAIDGTDHRGDVIYDVNSSEFYLGIGYGDNHKKSWTNTIKPKYDKALAADLSGSYGFLGISAKSTILPIDIPTPVKQVSNDGKKWAAANELTSASGSFWYRMEQFVPQETAENYYSKFIFTDNLPAGTDYAGKFSVVRTEDGKNVTSWFTCTAEKDVVKAEANASVLEKNGFYGYHYAVKFAVTMDVSEIEPKMSGNSAVYTVKNTVSVTARHIKDSSDTKRSSKEVTTTVSVKRPALADPVKGLDKSKTITEKILEKKSGEIVFSVWQSFPSTVAPLAPKQVTVTDVLEDALEYSSFSVYTTADLKTFTDKTALFKAACKGQTVTVTGEKNPELNNVTLRFDINCRIREGYDLSGYIKDGFYVIPNAAKVKVTYGYGDPAETEKDTNKAVIKLEAPPPDTFLEITKEIDAADIVAAHGNPVFIFKAAGTDIKGKEHTYYEAVEFTGQSADADGKKRETAVIKVKAGVYTVTEERTMRYSFGGIHSVIQGTASGERVVFDVSDAKGGSAVFYNKKTTDEEQGHTALVRNHFGR